MASSNGLKQDLGVVQGVGLLSTSLLGTGVFAVPAIVAQLSGNDSLWAWPLLIVLVFPIAIGFAALGQHFPNAGGAAHFVNLAFGPRLARVTRWLFLSVIPLGLPAALQIAAEFWAPFIGHSRVGILLVQMLTLVAIWLLGSRSAGSSASIQTGIAVLVVLLVTAIWWTGDINPAHIAWPALSAISWPNTFDSLAVMFWCFVGLEAFAHLSTEFRNPERDFPRALMIGMLIAGIVYWGCTVAILQLNAHGSDIAPTALLLSIVADLFGSDWVFWGACLIGYLACFASVNIYTQGFARLVWSQAAPGSRLGMLSRAQVPLSALSAVVLCSMLCCLLIYWLSLPLSTLIVYANGIFVLVYLLCMLAGCRLLKGRARLMAVIGSVLCCALLVMVGAKSLYALIMLAVLWWGLPHKSQQLAAE